MENGRPIWAQHRHHSNGFQWILTLKIASRRASIVLPPQISESHPFIMSEMHSFPLQLSANRLKMTPAIRSNASAHFSLIKLVVSKLTALIDFASQKMNEYLKMSPDSFNHATEQMMVNCAAHHIQHRRRYTQLTTVGNAFARITLQLSNKRNTTIFNR